MLSFSARIFFLVLLHSMYLITFEVGTERYWSKFMSKQVVHTILGVVAS